MERAIDPTQVGTLEAAPEVVAIPRPRPNGSYSVESLGRWADRLLGSDRRRERALDRLEPLFAKQDEVTRDPEPVEIPKAHP
jgi:hypothetical protein